MFNHPNSVCMTYFSHMIFALKVAFMLLIAAIKSFIHAFLPDCFITSTTDLVINLSEKLKNSGCRKESNQS